MHSYVYWMLSILGIGAVGYVPQLKSLSDGFLVLVFLMLFISNQGFFSKFTQQIGVSESAGLQTIGNAPVYNMVDVLSGGSNTSNTTTVKSSGGNAPVSSQPGSSLPVTGGLPSVNSSFGSGLGNLPSVDTSILNPGVGDTNLTDSTITYGEPLPDTGFVDYGGGEGFVGD